MTMDDGNSVYVGGLPYDVTDETLRREFSIYGTVLTIKIVNDKSVKGRCYGFVTFSNRRSADDAIEDMDGKSIGGRLVRVNEVTMRSGGRLNPGQGRFQQHSPGRRSGFDYDRDRFSDRSRERDRSQDRRKDQYGEKGRAYDEHLHGFERRNDRGMVDRSGYKERVFEGDEGDWRGGNGMGSNGISAQEGRSQETKIDDSTVLNDVRGRDHVANSSGDRNFQVKKELDALVKMREVLQDEILVMEDRLEEKEVACSELQRKSKRLEDLLINEKKLTSLRRKELSKLHKSYSRVRECTDNLKDREQELETLVNLAAKECMAGADE
ncbi:unnamed protein product [Cochlearia groenlandica]